MCFVDIIGIGELFNLVNVDIINNGEFSISCICFVDIIGSGELFNLLYVDIINNGEFFNLVYVDINESTKSEARRAEQ